MTKQNSCAHDHVMCVNHYEWIRKYRCADCRGVMMCACDEDFGRRCLPHQIERVHPYANHRSSAVTLGFVPRVCNTCRGLPEEAHPMAASYGRSNKVARFYWREIQRTVLDRFDRGARDQGLDGWLAASAAHANVRRDLERQVMEEVKTAHERSPKYDLREDSQDDVIRRHGIEIVPLRGQHVRNADGGLGIMDAAGTCGPEEFAARHFRRLGYQTLPLESRPFHVLFGVFLWMLIQDPEDPLDQAISFGERAAFERGEPAEMIWTSLPEDFGTSDYAARRSAAVEEHFRFLESGKDQLPGTFDYWIGPSEKLRQYLWAYREGDVSRAREVLHVLPPAVTLTVLRHLVDDYWDRYLGWPDLLCYRENEFFFAEVKSSKDKLGQNQKEWIAQNSIGPRLPFKLVKIHREPTLST
ncbi:MAG: hypothetical protein QOD94_3216 [Alphaproteobacteria bacterium]|jgi:hypothetical protein|nr:hypothetical protein [Alphaproteobacteria bacterium]